MCIICEDAVINWGLLIIATTTIIGLVSCSFISGRGELDEFDSFRLITIGSLIGLVAGVGLVYAPALVIIIVIAITLGVAFYYLGKRWGGG